VRARLRSPVACASLALAGALGCREPGPPTDKPVVLAVRARGEGALAQDDDALYWVDRGTDVPDPSKHVGKLWRLSKSGGLPTALTKDLAWPKGLAVDDTHAYWASFTEGRILRLAKSGSGSLDTLADGQSTPRALALDKTDVYFLNGTGEVRRVPKAGGASVTLVSGQQHPLRIAVDAAHVYWLTGGTTEQGAVRRDGSLMRCGKDGSHRVVLAGGLQEPGALALDDESVFWVDRAEGLVFRIEKDGGSARVLEKEQWNAQEIALDAEHVYWQLGEKILRARKTGGKPVAWTKGSYTVSSFVLDALRLYLLDNDGFVRASFIEAPRQ
jgi:hypothetical protein